MQMRRIASLLSLGLLATAAAGGFAHAADEAAPAQTRHSSAASHASGDTGGQSAALHALGVLLSRQLSSFRLSDRELHEVLAGIADGVQHPDTAKDAQRYVPQLQALEQTRAAVEAQREERVGQAYLSKVASLPNARTTASGLVFVPLQAGAGASPKIGDQVHVQYTGRLTDGSVFDSSAQHGGAVTFPLGHVIPCWDEALQLMKVGGSARVVCPPKLAYGTRGVGDVIKPGATLDFDVHLLGITPQAAATPAGPPGAPPLPAPH